MRGSYSYTAHFRTVDIKAATLAGRGETHWSNCATMFKFRMDGVLSRLSGAPALVERVISIHRRIGRRQRDLQVSGRSRPCSRKSPPSSLLASPQTRGKCLIFVSWSALSLRSFPVNRSGRVFRTIAFTSSNRAWIGPAPAWHGPRQQPQPSGSMMT